MTSAASEMDATCNVRTRASSRWARALAVCLAVLGLLVAFFPASAGATVGDVGFQDGDYGVPAGPASPSGEKAESKLWFNDGFWWASMLAAPDPTGDRDFHIFKLDLSTQIWADTGVALDKRASSRADVLWDGSKLYVASHIFDETPEPGSLDASRLYRYSYDAATDTYTKDADFPVTINGEQLEDLVIDKDSTGTLWATWVQDSLVYVSHTVGGNDKVWGAPYVIPVAGTSVSADDISALIAFGGKIGVMWSNQGSTPPAFSFAVHTDGGGDLAADWSVETALSGDGLVDDHINLKTASGKVYAAVKGSSTSSPHVALLVRSTGGAWSPPSAFGEAADNHTRPIVLLDTAHSTIYMLATSPETVDGGTIYVKSSPMSSISFPTGKGTPFIEDAASAGMNNATSTKQNLTGTMGLVVLATNELTKRYWHNFDPLGPPTNTSLPTITGTAQEGQTLTADPGTWTGSPTSYAYQWRRCNATGASCADIAGATAATYLLAAADVGKTIRVVVTASNASGAGAPATSAQTAVVTAAGTAPVNTAPPTIAGTALQGQTLTESDGTWTGTPAPTFTRQWRRCDASGGGCTDIPGATAATYLLAAADVGKTIRAVVTGTNSAGSSSATSAQTAVVAAGGGGGGGAGGGGAVGGGAVGGTAGGGGGGGSLPDLGVAVSASPSNASVGGTLNYIVTVTNLNAGYATGINLTDVLPKDVTLLSTYAEHGPGCTGTTTVRCFLDFLLGTNSTNVRITVRVDSPGELVNPASITLDQTDINPANNKAELRTTVAGPQGGASKHSGHAGPPKLRRQGGAFAPPLRARRVGRVGLVSVTIGVDEAALLKVSALAGQGKMLSLLKHSQVGSVITGFARSRISYELTDAGTVLLKLRLPLRLLKAGKTYQLFIGATDPDGESSTLLIPFRR